MQTKLNRAIKYRMYPTLEQVDLLNKTFGCVRFIWNQMLNDSAYFLSTTDVAFVPTPAKYKKDYPFLKEVDALALCNAQLNLKSAYRSYFSDPKKSFPNFKSYFFRRDNIFYLNPIDLNPPWIRSYINQLRDFSVNNIPRS